MTGHIGPRENRRGTEGQVAIEWLMVAGILTAVAAIALLVLLWFFQP